MVFLLDQSNLASKAIHLNPITVLQLAAGTSDIDN